ncbi:FAD-binding oxidoreductase [Jannaschia sp. W003]|uniref:NAD(P)/FAD-dependent oxidoreductase n=1 Tax=Jannaschia sp. W003 TaxID=2867012 RepID=UPI0021A30EE6|nr:FAD-binding oxidoreductase [Jannaschia sp. W003]
MGASVAWWLTHEGFRGRVLVVDRDLAFEHATTSHTNSCIRQQFSTELNVRISQFGAAYVQDLRRWMGGDPRVPDLPIQAYGYMYLAGSEAAAETLRENHAIQRAAGAGTRLMEPAQIAAEYPFYDLHGIVLGSHGTRDEGYFDGLAMGDWWRRQSRERGVEWIENEVAAIHRGGARVTGVSLRSGERIACGTVVNATGPRAAVTAAMAGIHDLPVEPRRRFTWIFRAERPLDRPLPLTIDPSGVHVRENGGGTYLAGCRPHDDAPPAFDDFAMDPEIWEDHAWPLIAARIPQFEALRLQAEWAGHYEYNHFDRNAVLGPHPEVEGFLFINGFSGHGLQQSPAMGRGLAEWIVHGGFRTLDLSPFRFDRIPAGRPLVERAVI